MSKYKKLDKFLEIKDMKVKDKAKEGKDFKKMSAKQKDELLETIARDLGYTE